MSENGDKKLNRIERLKKGLYSRVGFSRRRNYHLRPKKYPVNTGWGDEETLSEATEDVVEMSFKKKRKTKKSLVEKMLILVSGLFLLASGAVFLTIFGGVNSVSPDNVEITAIGPVAVESGGDFSLRIAVKNKNSSDLELADLIVTYPEGSKTLDNNDLNKIRKTLDTIPPGKTVKKEVRGRLYGEENNQKKILISLEYRVSGSNAIFFKEINYDVLISSSPVNLIVGSIEKSISGQELDLSVSIFSNTNSLTEGLLLSAEYPFGFEFKESDPKPDFGDNVWKISGEEETIKIRGSISGQEGEDRVFKFSCGPKSDNDEKEIGTIFAFAEKNLSVEKPFLGIDLVLNGEPDYEYVLNPNDSVRADILWSNDSKFKVLDGEFIVKLEGDIIDRFSVSADKGFYQSATGNIIWNKGTSGELSEIAPGDKGRFSFYFKPLDMSSRSSFKNPEINVKISTEGNRVQQEGVPEKIKSIISKKIKVSSDLNISAFSTYIKGPFVNSGPIPPRVDQETTYTITWAITNSMNDASDVVVNTALPPYVRWMGVVSPNTEKIIFNPVGGKITWEAGDVKSGTGSDSAPREVSFQVALLPSISQLDDILNLTGDVSISGIDNFTSVPLEDTFRGVSTRTSTDPGFTNSKAVIAE